MYNTHNQLAITSLLTATLLFMEHLQHTSWNKIVCILKRYYSINLFAGLPTLFLISFIATMFPLVQESRSGHPLQPYLHAALTQKGNLPHLQIFLFYFSGHLQMDYVENMITLCLTFLSLYAVRTELSSSLFLSNQIYSFTDDPSQL